MTCSRNFGRVLQAGCLGLIGALTVVGCGGSESKPPTPDAARPDTAVAIDGPVAPPALSLSVSPPSADFGSVVKGTSSATPTVITVKYANGLGTSLSPAVTSGPFAVVSTTCGTLLASGTCLINMSFTPTAVGPASGVLVISTGVSVTLTGTGLAPGLFTVTDKVELGTVAVNAPVAGNVTVTAVGALSGLSCLISGADLTADTTKVCPATLAAGGTCTLGFTFKAASIGLKNDAVVCSAAGTTISVPVTATVVNPASLAFQIPATVSVSTPAGVSSSPIAFTLVNSGGSSSGALTVTPAGDTTQFAVDNQCALPLAALSTCKINVVFKPATAGAKTLTLTVTDAAAPLTSVVATLNGVATPPGSLSLAGTGDFGTLPVGSASEAKIFTVTNPGQSDTGAVIIGITDPQFVLTSDGCSGLPIAAGKSCTVSVVFKPSAAGSVGASLSASAPGTAAASLPLSGVGTGAASLTLTPPTLDFGTTGVGVAVGPLNFTVTNNGGNATGALSVVKQDSTSSVGGASQFSFTTTCQAALAPAASCVIAVTFSPTIAGSASGLLTVSDGAVSSAKGTVIGIALAIPTLTITGCNTTAFDNTVVGQTSGSVVCTITNGVSGGSTETPQESGAITAAVTGDFAIATNNCTASLQPNTSCTVALVFKPTQKDTRTGTFTVTSANKGANNVGLSAIGLLPVQIVARSTTAVTGANPTGIVTGAYDFGQVALGGTSTATNLTLDVYVHAAVGNLAITGTDLTFGTATAPADFTGGAVSGSGAPPACASLTTTAPVASSAVYCSMVVTFTPKSKKVLSNTIKAAGADGTSSDTADMTGTGTGPITISPSPLTFDAVAVGTSGVQVLTLKVKNNSASAGSSATIAITGPNAADFAIVSDPISNLPLAASTEVPVTIRLTVPAGTAVGPLSATVTVSATIAGVVETATGSLVGSAVSGAGITATLNGTFADTVVTGISAPVTVTVKNTGALTTGAITAQMSGNGDFTITAPAGQAQSTCVLGTTTLAPNASCDLKVWFTPSAGLGVSTRSGTLSIGSVTGGMQVLSLTGKATGLLTITPGTLDLGVTTIGELTPATRTFTITNNGGQQVVPAVTFVNDIGQTGFPEIEIFTNSCNTAPLGAAGSTSPAPSCTVVVRLLVASGALPGPRAATLKVTGTVGGTNAGTATAVVTGTAALAASLQFTPVDPAIIATSASTVSRDFGNVVLDTYSAAQTFVVTNIGGIASSALSFAFYDLDASGAVTTTLHAKTADLDVGESTCVADGAVVQAGQSCTIKVKFHPTTCSGGACVTTAKLGGPTAQNGVQLVVTAAPSGTPTAGLFGPKLYGNAIPANVPRVTGPGEVAPYDLGASSGTFLLTITNAAPLASFIVPLTPTFANTANVAVGATGIVTGVGEFTVGTAPAGTANVCATSGTNTTLAAGGTCVFPVTWTPTTTPGTREVNVTFTDGSKTASIILMGRVLTGASLLAIPSPIATSSTPVDFGNAVVGVDSLTKTITIQNVGELATTDDLAVADMGTLASGQVRVLTGTTCEGPALAPLSTCTVVLAVRPVATGANAAVAAKKITLRGSATTLMRGDNITVSWTGVAAATLTPSLTRLAFDDASAYPGTGVLSTATFRDVTITNAAGAPATGPLSISTSVSDFYIDPDTANSTCLAAGLSFSGLAGGAHCAVRVYFSPVSLATPAKTGNLVVTPTSAPAITIPLTGTAIPALKVTATGTAGGTFTGTTSTANATLVYGVTSVTGTLPTQEFTFTKASGSPATGLLSTGIAGGATATPDQFRIITDTCIGVSLSDATPGTTDKCTVTVRFAPTTPTSSGTNKNAVLTVLDPASGTPADSISVTLTGTANP